MALIIQTWAWVFIVVQKKQIRRRCIHEGSQCLMSFGCFCKYSEDCLSLPSVLLALGPLLSICLTLHVWQKLEGPYRIV